MENREDYDVFRAFRPESEESLRNRAGLPGNATITQVTETSAGTSITYTVPAPEGDGPPHTGCTLVRPERAPVTREQAHRGRAGGVAGCDCRSCAMARTRRHIDDLIETSDGAHLDDLGRFYGLKRAGRTDLHYRYALLNLLGTGSTAPIGDALDKLGELVHFDKPAPEVEARLSFPNTPEPELGDYTTQELREAAVRARARDVADAASARAGELGEGEEKKAFYRAVARAVSDGVGAVLNAQPLPELVERDLSCLTCRRVFCRVRVSEGAVVEPVCPGCIVEGRT